MRDASVIEINLSDVDHNMRVMRQIVGPGCGLCPIVKADAYGLGAGRIAKRLANNGAELLAVYTPEQAADLFRAAVSARVLVLMPLHEIQRVDELYRGLISDRLQLTVHDLDHVGDLVAMTERFGVTIAVHMEVDTGMSRGGCSMEQAPAVLKRIMACRRLRLAGLFTHFASAESDEKLTDGQMRAFDRFIVEHEELIPKDCVIHVAGTYAALRHKRYHKQMVRIGLAWIGCGGELIEDAEPIAAAHQLRPIVSWKSRVVQVKTIAKGTSVGYGSRWTAKRPSVIGLVPVGYADGYPARLGSREGRAKGAAVAVLSEDTNRPLGFSPVVGAVNMDQITVDLTDAALAAQRRGQTIGVGAQVELITPDAGAPNHLIRLAQLADTIPHELLCRLNPRLKREYKTPVGHVERTSAVEVMVGASRVAG